MKSRNIKMLSTIGLSLAMQAAFAGNITDINVSTLPDNQKIIKITFDKDVMLPSGFTTTTPARIALDFANTNIQLAQPVLEYADPLLNQITAAQNNDRARILLGLNRVGQYNTEIKGNEVWVYVSESVGEAPNSSSAIYNTGNIDSNVVSRNIITPPLLHPVPNKLLQPLTSTSAKVAAMRVLSNSMPPPLTVNRISNSKAIVLLLR